MNNAHGPRALLAIGALWAACAAPGLLGLDNGLARRPPMGWLAWERFTCETDCARRPDDCIGERLFRAMADRLAADGYRAAGYEYVNIDDCWSELERRRDTGELAANASRFPAGLAALASYAHSLDLRLGLYGDCGTKTCGGYPAQLRPGARDHAADNHFRRDAKTLAEWRIDAFKFDGCFIDPLDAERVCPGMAAALNETRRPVLLTCEWPFYMMYAHAEPDFELAGRSCNMWRYYDDIEDSWQSVLNTIDYTVRHQSTIVKFHGPGHWFDPDQLVIGNFGLSYGQARAQMALWCVWAAPLYMSNDLRSIDPQLASLLKNRKLIAVDQDELGVFGLMVAQSADGQLQVFVKPVGPVRNACPSFAMVFLNRGSLGNRVTAEFGLRDLLLAAPIKQAAHNQRQLLAGAEAASGPEVIDVDACLSRLRASGADRRAQSDDWFGPAEAAPEEAPPTYALEDLFGDEPELGRVRLNESLRLSVNPSGVRAISLTEQLL